jgi:hypothetical protein
MNIKKKGGKQMIEFISNLAQLFIIYWIVGKILKYTVFRRFSKKKNKKHGLSISGKIWVLISRQLHSSLDGLLRQQSKALREKKSLAKQTAQQDTSEKVIQFKNYKRKVVK